MIVLTPRVLEELQAYGRRSYPYEGCGLLMGHMEEGCNVVEALYPVENRWHDAEERRVRFRITAEDMARSELAAAERGLEVVGVYHSHPDHPAVASPRDLAWAGWNGYSYVITEVRQGLPLASRSWQLRQDRSGFDEETVEVTGS